MAEKLRAKVRGASVLFKNAATTDISTGGAATIKMNTNAATDFGFIICKSKPM